MTAKPDVKGLSGQVDRTEVENRSEQIDYIRQMVLELRAMAAGAEAPTLAYLLEMSALEAAEVLKLHEFRNELRGGR